MDHRAAYSYRDNKDIPDFDDTHPVMIFDGVCVLCSGGAAKLIKWDKKGVFRFATAQSKLGQALLKHYDCDALDFNTVLLISEGRAFVKSDAYLETAKLLGGLWHLPRILWIIPKFIRDPIYDWKARNRYNWFGKTEYCKLIPEDIKNRFLDM